jgi:hydroxyacylglutathione hydrolase
MRFWRFVCNPYAENTYLIAAGREAWLIDPGFYTHSEKQHFLEVLEREGLELRAIYLTHAHIDHVLGVRWVVERFGVPLYYHAAEEVVYRHAGEWAMMMGLQYEEGPEATAYVEEGELVWGDLPVQVRHVPGHSPGSVAYYFPKAERVFSGDVLFAAGIGNYHLPLADYETLMRSIVEKLLPLGEVVEVWPGHGPSTTIGTEKVSNPFLKDAV